MQNVGGGSNDAMNCPFVIILSDGRFNKNNVKPYLREAKEKRYLYIFVILDTVREVD
jgi:Mg-chelatase subunit ChlD